MVLKTNQFLNNAAGLEKISLYDLFRDTNLLVSDELHCWWKVTWVLGPGVLFSLPECCADRPVNIPSPLVRGNFYCNIVWLYYNKNLELKLYRRAEVSVSWQRV